MAVTIHVVAGGHFWWLPLLESCDLAQEKCGVAGCEVVDGLWGSAAGIRRDEGEGDTPSLPWA